MSLILDRIHDPSDVKQLNLTEVQQLCEELRAVTGSTAVSPK